MAKDPIDPEHIVRRWLEAGDVVPFGKPGSHTVEIAGKKYVLSDDGGPLGLAEELGSEDGGPGTGHARLIRLPSQASKWKYLWVYDTDKQILAMWRVTDGNEKVWSPARSETHRIVRLDKKGQLNRVSNVEFRKIEALMRKIEHETLEALKKSIAENETDYQKTVNRLAQDYFDRYVRPQIERAVRDIDAGVTPLGFKPFGPPDEPKRRQMITHVISKITAKDFTPEKVEAYLRLKGIDPEAPEHDNQAAEWAVWDIRDAVFDEFHKA